MHHALRAAARAAAALALAAGCGAAAAANSPEAVPGRTVASLLDLAAARNPDYAAMRAEASAAGERIGPAGALPDPRLKVELQDITMGGEQNPTLSPSRVGATRYQLMQDLPWAGKRELRRSVAVHEADAAEARARASWLDIAARLKLAHAQSWYLAQNERLGREILELMTRLEKVAQARYASGLAAQQDVIRAQVELSALSNELIALESERRLNRVQINTLLARPAGAALAEPEQMVALPAPARLDYAALEERLRNRSPQLFADEARVQAAQQSRELTLKNRYPDLTLGIAPMQTGRSVKNWELMVELNIPLQQSTRRSQEREAEAMLSAARSRKDATANQLLADLAGNLAALDGARRTEQSIAGRLMPQAELTFQAALAGYEHGKVDFGTLLDAQRQIRMAKQNRLKAQLDGVARLVEIEKIVGEEQ